MLAAIYHPRKIKDGEKEGTFIQRSIQYVMIAI